MRAMAVAALCAALAGCGGPGCISSKQAREWSDMGRQAEASGRIYDAWRAYKSVGIGPACDSSSRQREIANEHRGRLRDEINLAYDATEKAIHAYRAANGRLPGSLSEVANDIPDSARRAFAGFRYEIRKDNSTFILDRRAG